MFTTWHLGQLFDDFTRLSTHTEQQQRMQQWIPTLIVDLMYDKIIHQGVHLTHHAAFSFLSFLWLYACEHYTSQDIEHLFTPVLTADLPLSLDTDRLARHVPQWGASFQHLLLRQVSIIIEDAVYGEDSPFEQYDVAYYDTRFPPYTLLEVIAEQCRLFNYDFYHFLLHNGLLVHPEHLAQLHQHIQTASLALYQHAWADYYERLHQGQVYAPVHLFHEYRTIDHTKPIGYI